MYFSITLCLVTYLMQLCNTHSVEAPSPYECGPHGKFEYCINGMAGCVIGCHCHPGFYFDTDTKICEPNSKLARDLKRRYMAKPTRAYPISTPTVLEIHPTVTPMNAYAPWVEETEKDNDNLGEWLYNQFFKTIENQVVNNTDEAAPSRRSGNDKKRISGGKKRGIGHRETDDHDLDAVKKKAHKIWKGKSKRKKTKVHGLRRKLLRITEDDSLFDSDEHSSESGDHSSSSEDDDSDSDKSSSSRAQISKEQKDNKDSSKDDRQHGHKKVIIFNRRPRPPLPSFIFLPSMDTPYYPPIGLPPPPILPMYPMVPVPPMAPFLPYPEHNNDSNASTTTVPSAPNNPSNTETTTGTVTTTTTTTTTTTVATDVTAAPSEPNENKGDLRSKYKFQKGRKGLPPPGSSEETFMMRARDDHTKKTLSSKQAERLKLIRRFKEKLKKRKNNTPAAEIVEEDHDSAADEIPDEENSSLYSPNIKPKHKPKQKRKDTDKSASDVNFKYLSELIHRLNHTKDKPTFKLEDDLKQFDKIQNARRSYDSHKTNEDCGGQSTSPPDLSARPSEDAYFTNLGRQIACMVRSVESKLDGAGAGASYYKSPHKEIHALINEYSYSPRSFWERSVRSPITKYKNYIGRFDKHSSEKNLLSLENEVSFIASTTPPLSLQDLENILSTLHKFQSDSKNKRRVLDRSSASFNVDLLLNKLQQPEAYYRKFDDSIDDSVYAAQVKSRPNVTNMNYSTKNLNAHYLAPMNIDMPMINDWMFNYRQNALTKQIPNQSYSHNKTFEHENHHYNSKRTFPPYPMPTSDNNHMEYSKLFNNLPYKDHNVAPKPELEPKYIQKHENYREMHLQPEKLPQLPAKHITVAGLANANYREPPSNNLPATYSELLAKYPDTIEKIPDLLARFPTILAKYRNNIPVKYNKIHTNYADLRTKFSELPVKYPAVPKYNKPPIVYHNPKYPLVHNYNKALNYFTDDEDGHEYMYESSYPLAGPYKLYDFAKRFETYSSKPSYFHQDIHHFDYME